MNPKLVAIIRTVLEQYPSVKLGYLFGSQVTGKIGPLSDVDVAVYLDAPTPRERFAIKLDLIGSLISALGRNDIDVVVLNDAGRPNLKYHIIFDGHLLYQLDAYRLRVEPRILREYFDFRASLERHQLIKASV